MGQSEFARETEACMMSIENNKAIGFLEKSKH